MRNFRHLHLLCFLLFTSLLMCCPLCYSLPCRNYFSPIKNKLYNCIFCNDIYFPFRMFFRKTFCFNKQMFFTLTHIFYESFVASFYYNFIFHNLLLVDEGGTAPPSRTLFSLLHTAITNIITGPI